MRQQSGDALWFVVLADGKKNAGLKISRVVLDALKSLKTADPKSTAKRQRQWQDIRTQLER